MNCAVIDAMMETLSNCQQQLKGKNQLINRSQCVNFFLTCNKIS